MKLRGRKLWFWLISWIVNNMASTQFNPYKLISYDCCVPSVGFTMWTGKNPPIIKSPSRFEALLGSAQCSEWFTFRESLLLQVICKIQNANIKNDIVCTIFLLMDFVPYYNAAETSPRSKILQTIIGNTANLEGSQCVVTTQSRALNTQSTTIPHSGI